MDVCGEAAEIEGGASVEGRGGRGLPLFNHVLEHAADAILEAVPSVAFVYPTMTPGGEGGGALGVYGSLVCEGDVWCRAGAGCRVGRGLQVLGWVVCIREVVFRGGASFISSPLGLDLLEDVFDGGAYDQNNGFRNDAGELGKGRGGVISEKLQVFVRPLGLLALACLDRFFVFELNGFWFVFPVARHLGHLGFFYRWSRADRRRVNCYRAHPV